MKKHFLFFVAALCLALLSGVSFAGDVVVSTGTSSALKNAWGESGNKSAMHSLRYAGDRFGLRYDRSVRGDDAGNYSLTGDIYARPFGGLVLAGGIGIFHERLRGLGEKENFHALIGWEFPRVVGNVGAGVWYDHWSNGRRIFNRSLDHNPPRNVLSFGVVMPL